MVRRVRKRKAKGGAINWRSLLSKAHKYAKDNKLASRGLNALGLNKASQIASILGYGKSVGGRRRRLRRRRARGAGFFDDVWSGVKTAGRVATNVASVIPHPYAQVGSTIGRAVGFGKKRRMRGGMNIPSNRSYGGALVNPRVMVY